MSTDPTAAEPSARYTLGVLFVRGIEVQRRGETLAACGQPLYRWLEAACEALQGRWLEKRVSCASVEALYKQIKARDTGEGEAEAWALAALHDLLHERSASGQPDLADRETVAKWLRDPAIAVGVSLNERGGELPEGSPAHRELIFRRLGIDGSLTEERWLLAESWWAGTFSSPRFLDLAGWGLRIIPWTLGSHFGAGLRRVWLERSRTSTSRQRVQWLGRLAAAFLRLLWSLVLSLLALAALAVLLLFAALPVPRLRDTLGRLQRQIASSLGDSYVLVSHPFEAAAIVGQVSRDLECLAAPSLCERLAVVAHSQGAAVAHEALRRHRPQNLRLLLTFGSGLRKLEELRGLLRKGNQLASAGGLTLLGLVLTALLLWGVAALRGDFLLPLGFPLILAFGLLIAGLWDFVAGIDLAGLKWRIDRLAKSGIRWVDCYATHDPVPNGPILDPPDDPPDIRGELAELPTSRVVLNEGSTRRDHTSYWANLDQFVGLVVSELAKAAGKGPSSVLGSALKVNPGLAEFWFRRRRWRVRWLFVVRWIATLSVVLAVVADEGMARIGALARCGLLRAEEWLRKNVSFLVPESDGSGLTALPPFLLGLGAILLAYGFARWTWGRWNQIEMSDALYWDIPTDVNIAFLLAVWGQLLVLTLPLLRFGLPLLVLLGESFLALLFAMSWTMPSKPWNVSGSPKPPEWRPSRAVRVGWGLAGLLGCNLSLAGLALLGAGFQSLLKRASGWDPGSLAAILGLLGLLLALYLRIRYLRIRRSG